ncbi:MAG: UDP-N-acetylglucosamine 1-carboxyvinyltransferase [Spirochaetota bacterium]
MSSYIIEGGYPLSGRVTASGNKNAALPCIAASLLTDEEVILRNVPEIKDVRVMLNIIGELGSSVRRLDRGVYSIQTGNIVSTITSREAEDIRASILFAAPLLCRTGKVELPPPGGDVIGFRRLDTHFIVFSSLGALTSINEDQNIQISCPHVKGGSIFLDEASVTATENAVMAAALAEGTTVIRNAASEPHVQDLCRLLVAMGATIEGIGSNLLTIHGVKQLRGADMTIGPDFMEIGSFIGLAAATKGDIEIEHVDPRQLEMIKLGFGRLGISWELEGSTLYVPVTQKRQVVPEVSGMIPTIDDAPWPGFPADLLSIITVAATQIPGTILVHEKMFESRMYFVDMLIRMGAYIILCDPHRAVVSGPAPLHGALVTSPDVRAGMALVIAALTAEGNSEIQNVLQIERGYENLCQKLTDLGARIQRTK